VSKRCPDFSQLLTLTLAARKTLTSRARRGDEFGVLLSHRAGRARRNSCGTTSPLTLNPLFIDGHELYRSASIGTGYATPQNLGLEFTEKVFAGNFVSAQNIFRNLQIVGVGFAMDDFGTGQSSLSYLHDLPFHLLKIDQQFVSRIPDGETQATIVANVFRMAESLGLSTIAEDVETCAPGGVAAPVALPGGAGLRFAPGLAARRIRDFLPGPIRAVRGADPVNDS